MAKLGRMAPETFRELTACSTGELRLVTQSHLSCYLRSDHTFDADRARLVLEGIRQARREV